MKSASEEIWFFLLSSIFAFVLANLGGVIIKDFPDKPYLGIITIILAFILVYFCSYILQIRNNKSEIEDLSEEVDKIKRQIEMDEKLLNTIKDIKLLENKKRKNE